MDLARTVDAEDGYRNEVIREMIVTEIVGLYYIRNKDHKFAVHNSIVAYVKII